MDWLIKAKPQQKRQWWQVLQGSVDHQKLALVETSENSYHGCL